MPEIKNLHKYFGEHKIFDGFSHLFPANGAFALCGTSGSGKTTLFRILSGLDTDFQGEITGFDSVGVCFQEYRLFDTLNALSNVTDVAFAQPTAGDTAKAAAFLSSIGFSEKDMRLFPAELSGGMKQRVALARAFLHDSPILLLDEPFKELDAALTLSVAKKIREAAETRLVLFTVHTVEEAQNTGATLISIT